MCIFFILCYRFIQNKISKFATENKTHPSKATLLVDISEKMLYAVLDGKIVKKYPVAIGKPDTPSPLGDFIIIRKDKWGEGFGTSWLGLDVPWGMYGIHGTTMPGSIGRAASHGCIRMKNKDINDLYKIVEVGTPVKIMGGLYGMMGNGYRILLPGDRGADVLTVQKRLKELGYFNGTPNGIYGGNTLKALYKFEESRNLPLKNNIEKTLYEQLGIILFE